MQQIEVAIKLERKPITSINELTTIEKFWREIYSDVQSNSVFASFDYIMLWYKSFAKPDQIRIYPIFDGENVIGFIPLVLYKKGIIRILTSLTNQHSFHPVVLLASGYDDNFSNLFFDTILSDKYGWDILDFKFYAMYQQPDSQNLVNSKKMVLFETQPTYSILLPDSYNEYLNKQLSQKMRKNLKNEIKRLSKASSHEFIHYVGDEAIDFWPKFLEIEDSGWKGASGSSLKKLPANYCSYYEGLLDLLLKNNQLHVYALKINNEFVAGGFCYIDQDILHFFKSGYLEDYSYYSPSNMLLLSIVENLILNNPEVKRLHLFPSDFGYKHRFDNEGFAFLKGILYNRTILGKTGYLFAKSKQHIKKYSLISKVLKIFQNSAI